MRQPTNAPGNTAPSHEETVELSVDQDDLIVRVNAAWDHFALDNDGAHLANNAVLGWNLLDSVSGKTSKSFMLALLELARRRDREVCFDYRCDSPRLRRFMRARLRSDSSGAVHFSHEHLYSEAFPHLVTFKTAAQRARDTAIRCSLCNHVRHDGLWKLPEFVSQQVFDGRTVSVTYGICPSCLDMLEEAR
ncbi:MAG: hypothetical protein GJU76_12400 [Gallionella sp.]|jgi:hypothetical protein|nr:hypothetical protein [Gallionella sp.]